MNKPHTSLFSDKKKNIKPTQAQRETHRQKYKQAQKNNTAKRRQKKRETEKRGRNRESKEEGGQGSFFIGVSSAPKTPHIGGKGKTTPPYEQTLFFFRGSFCTVLCKLFGCAFKLRISKERAYVYQIFGCDEDGLLVCVFIFVHDKIMEVFYSS